MDQEKRYKLREEFSRLDVNLDAQITEDQYYQILDSKVYINFYK